MQMTILLNIENRYLSKLGVRARQPANVRSYSVWLRDCASSVGRELPYGRHARRHSERAAGASGR